MRKKFLSIVLCVCMMLTMVPFAFAEEGDSTGTTVQNSEELVKAIAAANDGDTITLGAGTFTTYGKTSPSKKLTFIGAGSDKTVWNIGNIPAQDKAGEYNCDYSFDSCDTITFKNMKMVNGTKDYMGFARIGNLNFEHCMFEGRGSYWGYQSTTFNNCTFTAPAGDYAITDYTSPVMTFNGCTFNVSGKTVNAYVEKVSTEAHKIIMKNCTVDSTKTGKSVLNIKNANQAWDVEISNTKVTGLDANATTGSNLYQVETTGSKGKALTVSVDGKTVWKNGAPAVEVAEVNGVAYTSLEDAITAAKRGDTVTLLKDIQYTNNGEGLINITKSITLDGANHTITGYGARGLGKKCTTIAVNDDGTDVVDVTFKNLTIVNNAAQYGRAIEARGNIGTLSIDNCTVQCENANSTALMIGGRQKTAAKIVLNNTAFDAGQSGYPITLYNPANITINNSTLKGFCGIDFEGANDSEGSHGSSVTATNSKFDAPNIYTQESNSYGVFVLVDDNITIGLTDCEINAEKKNTAEQAVILAHESADRTANGFTVTVQGDKTKVNADLFCTIQSNWTSTDKMKVAISDGYFTSDPSDYCVSGKTGIPSDKSGYAFMVGTANTTVDVTPVTGTPAVDEKAVDSLNVSNSQKAEIKSAASNVTDTSGVLAAAAKQEASNVSDAQVSAAEQAIKNSNVSNPTDENIKVYVQTYLSVTPTNAETSSNEITSITLDIQPMSRIVASTASTSDDIQLDGQTKNAVVLESSVKPINIQNMTIRIALPSSFNVGNNTSVYVQHKGYEYTATVTDESGTKIATFTNPHGFSEFTISTTSQTVAKIGETNYTSLQDAVNAANDGDTITVTKDSNLTASMSGSSRTITVKNGTANEIKVTINGTEKTIEANKTETFTYTRPSHSSSGSTTYAVNVNAATNGAVAADKKTAAKGTTVTVTATPSAGYVVDSVKVVDKDGKDVAVSEKDGKYVFTMPASAVTVTAVFKAETPAPSALPFVDVKSGDWFYDAVKYAYENGLMNGTGETVFAPNGTMNRAMIVTVLYRLEKSPAVTSPAQFKDVPAGQWYSDAVAWAAANNIVNGYDETTFGPLNAVTREQMAAILYRYEQYKGMDTVTLEENLARFPDKDKVSAYAVPAMQWAVGQKVINGNADGTLDPTGTATRAQVAQIFSNLLNK